jgi:hypothetical protein
MKIEKFSKGLMRIGSHEITPTEQLALQKKTKVEDVCKDIENQVRQRNLNPAFAAMQLKHIAKVVIGTTKNIEEDAIEALTLEDKEGLEYEGYCLKFRDGSRTVDYSGIPEIENLEKQLKETKEKYKQALLGIERNSTVLDSGTRWVANGGEVLPLPAWKYNKSSLVLSKMFNRE